MEYKYVVTGPSRDAGGQYEFLYKKASGQAIINRELSIPNEKCRVDGTFLCFIKIVFFSELRLYCDSQYLKSAYIETLK